MSVCLHGRPARAENSGSNAHLAVVGLMWNAREWRTARLITATVVVRAESQCTLSVVVQIMDADDFVLYLNAIVVTTAKLLIMKAIMHEQRIAYIYIIMI